MSQSNQESQSNDLVSNSKPRGSGLTAQMSPWLGALLGEVISQTDQLVESDQPGGASVPDVLRQVAQRHKGKDLCIEPVITELVEAVICDLASRISQDELRKRLVRHVAETLHDDPAAYNRIAALWANLQRSLS